MNDATDQSAILLWVRRDLRLADHPAWAHAVATGRPIIPVYILESETEQFGAAPKWRLGEGLRVFARTVEAKGARLILRRGVALDVLRSLIDETGARSVFWQRRYDPTGRARDTEIKSALTSDGIEARSFAGQVLFEPWTVATKTGGFYKVYTPFWKSVRQAEISAANPAPARIPAPETWPASEPLEAWTLGAELRRGAPILARHATVPGSAAAEERLDAFVAGAIGDYASDRDLPDREGTSRLSAALAWGEIGPRQCWHAGKRALAEGRPGAETWLKELVWREFAHHLIYHTPHIVSDNWRPEWDAFTWSTDPEAPEIRAWCQGRTGIPFVDAAMRELYVTGTMHNRGRMIVASYLTKHLMTHWKIGQRWFEECLVDWEPAANAMGWQWSAGSGPDATPYFRVFNPVTQRDKFDRNRVYVDRWIAEGKSNPSPEALAYFDAIPLSWGLSPTDPYPAAMVTPEAGRARALAAYSARSF